MVTKVILTRHGETEFKTKGLLDGQLDTKLTKKGIKQAKKIGKKLKKEHIDMIYFSPLVRSRLTAELIKKELKNEIPVIKIKEFIEINCGECHGLNKEMIQKKFPKLIEGWNKNIDPPFPGGENLADVEKRALPSFQKIVSENKDKTILIVGHGALNLAVIGYYLKIPYGMRWKIRQDNCCVNEIDFENGEFGIVKINEPL